MSLILSPSPSNLFLLPTLPLPDIGMNIDLNVFPDKNAAAKYIFFSMVEGDTKRAT